jgi:hypothetical protein
MTTPRTELDTRFSEPAARPTSWEDTLEAIEHFSTGRDEQKARNLAGNPHVALTTGANDWQSDLDVVVEGVAARVTSQDGLRRIQPPELAERSGSSSRATRWRARYRRVVIVASGAPKTLAASP